MPVATLTSKGQITIPASVRTRLGLRTGDQVDFVLAQDGKVTLEPKRMGFEGLRGLLRSTRRRPLSLREMDEAIQTSARLRWRRAARTPNK
jgi:antitoxin PrlF